MAKNFYLDVVDSPVNPDHEELADESWVKKAGLLALPLLSPDEVCPTNFFNRMESLLPQIKETLEKKRTAWGVPKN